MGNGAELDHEIYLGLTRFIMALLDMALLDSAAAPLEEYYYITVRVSRQSWR